ncbi:AraC family transcriptional regulator [Pseudomonas sp. WCS374]|mgnify:CR=1 FL=1|uniref:helix-turn-helix domain-containing protein n=1 Tax=Pseudomonas sp. WCS374 TaxID=1495331 RepID=UPI0009E365D2|nr:AraC family transcriptional regulator [Pseudomonas sp. WCS374]
MIPGIESKRGNTRSPIIEQLCSETVSFTWSRPVAIHDQRQPSQTPPVAHTKGAPLQGAEPARWGLAPWQERRAKELMLGNLTSRMKVEEVAEACKLSRSHFSRAFKVNTGVSPSEWLINARLERAKELLLSGTTAVSDVALACGFCDQSHFTRLFQSRIGSPPAAWRHRKKRASQ